MCSPKSNELLSCTFMVSLFLWHDPPLFTECSLICVDECLTVHDIRKMFMNTHEHKKSNTKGHGLERLKSLQQFAKIVFSKNYIS